MDGVWAPRPSSGPHKLRECLPLQIILRNRLKYALTGRECMQICMEGNNAKDPNAGVRVDGKIRTDYRFPAGFMDVVEIKKANDVFRLLYDTKGRFVLHRIQKEETKFKLCKVTKSAMTGKAIPYIGTHDGRTIRYPDPLVKENDTVKVDLATGKMVDFIKLDVGNVCMVFKGGNTGRVGVLQNIERHPGSFDIAHLKDSSGNVFATRLPNIFTIGSGTKPWVSLPKGKGVKLTIMEEKQIRASKGQR